MRRAPALRVSWPSRLGGAWRARAVHARRGARTGRCPTAPRSCACSARARSTPSPCAARRRATSARGSSCRPACARATSGSASSSRGSRASRGSPASIVAFADAHPDLPIEVTPPLHTLLNSASGSSSPTRRSHQGLDGSGRARRRRRHRARRHPPGLPRRAGTHARRVAARSLVAAARRARGPRAEVRRRRDASGRSSPAPCGRRRTSTRPSPPATPRSLPHDEVGHGTLVTACAAGNGLAGSPMYRGIAPGATIVLARITGAGTASIDTDDVLLGVGFLFDRADRARQARRRQPLARQRLRPARRDDGLGAGARELRRPRPPWARARGCGGQQRIDLAGRRAARSPERVRELGRDDARPDPRRRLAGRRRAGLGRDARGRLDARRARRPRRHLDRPGRRRDPRPARTPAATRRPSTTAASRPTAPCPPSRTAPSWPGKGRGPGARTP